MTKEDQKSAKAIYHKAYYAKNSEKLRAYTKQYTAEHLEKRLAYNAAWRAAHPNYSKTKSREWKHANPERVKEYAAISKPKAAKLANIRYHLDPAKYIAASIRSHKKHATTVKVRLDAYRSANEKQIKAKAKLYRQKNSELLKKSIKAWRKANPELVRADKQNRRSREMNAEGSHTAHDILNIYSRQHGKCNACTCRLKKSGKHTYHIDHIIALKNGGSNWPDNLQLLCPPCNMTKSAKDDLQWANEHGLLFVL